MTFCPIQLLARYVAATSASAVYSNMWGHGLKDQVAGIEQRVHFHVTDLFGNNLTAGGDVLGLAVTLAKASYNASRGAFFGADPTVCLPRVDDTGGAACEHDAAALKAAAPRSAYRPIVKDLGNGR